MIQFIPVALGFAKKYWKVIAVIAAVLALVWIVNRIYDAGGDAREAKIYAEQAEAVAKRQEEDREQRRIDAEKDAALSTELDGVRQRLAYLQANPPKPETLIKRVEVIKDAPSTTCTVSTLSDDFRVHYNAVATELQTGKPPAD